MNLDPHWLKENFKGLSDLELADLHYRAYMFDIENEQKMFKAELDRREKEYHETNG